MCQAPIQKTLTQPNLLSKFLLFIMIYRTMNPLYNRIIMLKMKVNAQNLVQIDITIKLWQPILQEPMNCGSKFVTLPCFFFRILGIPCLVQSICRMDHRLMNHKKQ